MRKRVSVALVVAIAALTSACTPSATPSQTPSTQPSLTSAPSPTPITGLPDDHTLSPINAHVGFGKWGFIATDSANPVGVRINGLWRGTPGELADRSYSQPAGQDLDVNLAVPYYLSWSMVVLDGSAQVEPQPFLLPSDKGNLYSVGSPFSDHDCPDYTPTTATGVGFLVTHCVVSMSIDDGYPVGIAFAVPDHSQQFWFMDAPSPTDAADYGVSPSPTPTPTTSEVPTPSKSK